MKKVVFGIATIPSREHLLPRVLASIYDQADIIEVALNDWDHVPSFLHYPKIKINHCTNEMGDANKFLNVEKYQDHYYFSIDDDIIYPADYVEKYAHILSNLDDVLVSIHGRNVPDEPITNYYKGCRQVAHCLNKCDAVYADIVGSGVAGFDTKYLKIKYDRFIHPNMADIFLSMQAKEQGIYRYCMQHEANWITGKQPKPFTIYDRHKNDCQIQTDLVNSFNWKS